MTTYSGGKPAPANDRQHPDFTPGNTVSTHHGAYSPRRVDPLAAELVERMTADDDVGYLRTPSVQLALWAWARAEARVQLLTEYLAARAEDGVGDPDDKRTRAAWIMLDRAESRAESGRARLGLDPLSRARLGKDVAQGRQADAAAALTAMREEHERYADDDEEEHR